MWAFVAFTHVTRWTHGASPAGKFNICSAASRTLTVSKPYNEAFYTAFFLGRLVSAVARRIRQRVLQIDIWVYCLNTNVSALCYKLKTDLYGLELQMVTAGNGTESTYLMSMLMFFSLLISLWILNPVNKANKNNATRQTSIHATLRYEYTIQVDNSIVPILNTLTKFADVSC